MNGAIERNRSRGIEREVGVEDDGKRGWLTSKNQMVVDEEVRMRGCGGGYKYNDSKR